MTYLLSLPRRALPVEAEQLSSQLAQYREVLIDRDDLKMTNSEWHTVDRKWGPWGAHRAAAVDN